MTERLMWASLKAKPRPLQVVIAEWEKTDNQGELWRCNCESLSPEMFITYVA
jgi:hypothetical protein